MELTEKIKNTIDGMSYIDLLRKWRYGVLGDPLFQGESGEYYAQRMAQLRAEPGGDSRHVAASKAIGLG